MGEETGARQYWFNTRTGQVEEGSKKSSWTHLLGPYPTREDAQRALDTARQRNDAWEDEDARWRGNRPGNG